MKIYILLIATALMCLKSLAQDKYQTAPLNPDFIEYMEAKKNSGKFKSGETFPLGYVPSPLKLYFNENRSQTDDRKKATLPSKYDLRDFNMVTSVKNQGAGENGGNCWTFTALGALESYWLKLGLGTYDLSEQHLAACHGFEWGYGEGGNEALSMAYFTRLHGPVLESQHPYNTDDTAIYCKEIEKPISYVTEAVWLPEDDDIIKQAILDYGALSISMRWEGGAYNSTDHTFYYDGFEPVNHAVLLVGWDDSKETGGQPGAWICKNQWDNTWGDDGYFYISYFDTRVNKSVAYFPTKLPMEEIDTLYMYDTLASVASIGLGSNTAYGLVKFEAPDTQFINKIGTFLNTENTVIDIEIYDDFDGKSLTNKLAEAKNQTRDFPGFYTFDVPAMVSDDFYVKIKYITPNNDFPLPVEQKADYEGEAFARPSIETGKYWMSRTGNFWTKLGQDVQGKEADICIRAYASKDNPTSFFNPDRELVCQDGGKVVFTDNSFGNIDSLFWEFGEGASPLTATDTVTKQSHEVNYNTTGKKTITLIAYSSNGNDTLVKEKVINVTDSIHVTVPLEELTVVSGQEFSLTATGADQYTWSSNLSANTSDTSVLTESFVTNELLEVVYSVKGTSGACVSYDTVLILVQKNPKNDYICDAIELEYGKENGPFTNKFATVEDNEPSPPENGCVAPKSWCLENGLQNSIWFKFTAQETGRASIEVTGFDCQVAVYEAGGCDSILLGNYTLLAANDDVGLITKDARIDVVSGLTPGETYWLQLDGSAGGDTGSAYIYLLKWGYSVEENPDNKLLVFPNPASDQVTIDMPVSGNNVLSINIFDMNGRLIYQQAAKSSGAVLRETLDTSGYQPGIYNIQVINGMEVLNRKLIVQ